MYKPSAEIDGFKTYSLAMSPTATVKSKTTRIVTLRYGRAHATVAIGIANVLCGYRFGCFAHPTRDEPADLDTSNFGPVYVAGVFDGPEVASCVHSLRPTSPRELS